MQRTLSPIVVARELRKRQTIHEKIFWEQVRNRKLGFKFNRQKPLIVDSSSTPVRFYVVDFYCAEKRLVVEIDGEIHLSKQEEDMAREQELTLRGYRIVRFTNKEVENVSFVLEKLLKVLNEKF